MTATAFRFGRTVETRTSPGRVKLFAREGAFDALILEVLVTVFEYASIEEISM